MQDADGSTVREADAVLDPGTRPDRMRATSLLSTTSLVAGEYVLVVEARDGGSSAVRHAVPLTFHASEAAPTTSADEPAPADATSRAAAAAPPLRPLAVAHGPTTTHPQRGPQVIRDSASWNAFWLRLPTRQPPPDIDFERVTLIALVIDSDGSTPVQPVVERIEREGDAVVVYWHSAPSTQAGVSATSGAPPRPFTVVGIIGHDGPVRFHARD